MKSNKGITLIALIITIIVLLILAGVSIKLILDPDTGILKKASIAKDITKIEDYKERIILIVGTEFLEKTTEGKTETLKELVKVKLGQQDWVAKVLTSEDESYLQDNQLKVITTDNYGIIFEILENGQIQWGDIGKEDGEPYPKLTLQQLPLEGIENEKIKIKVIAEVEKTNNTKKIDTIKLENTGETKHYEENGVVFEIEGNGMYSFTAITNMNKSSTKSYMVNVQDTKETISIKAIPNTPRNTTSTGTQNGIEKGPVSVTITYENNNLQKQYKIGTQDWISIKDNSVTIDVTENTTITARYFDGTNGMKITNYIVENVDNVPPVFINYNATVDQTVITVTALAKDSASSGASSNIADILKYQYSINGTSYQSSNKFTVSSAGNYTVYIKAIDKAGNQTVVTKSVTVPSYTIYYNSNGGIGAPASQTAVISTSIKLSSIKPTRDGYVFFGWSTSSEDTESTYSPGETYIFNSDTILYAVWKNSNIKFTNGSFVHASTAISPSGQASTAKYSSSATIPSGYTITIKYSVGSAKGNSNVLATFDSETIINKSSEQGSHENNTFKYTTSKEGTLYLEANSYAEGSGTIEVISIIDKYGNSYNFNSN